MPRKRPTRVRELEEWGALFDRTKDGLILQRDFGGHRFARLAHIGDRTGLELIRTLQQKAVADGIEVFMEVKVLRLLHDADGAVSGLVGYWRPSGEFVVFTAKAVVMATGGVGKSLDVHLQLVGVDRRRPRHGPVGRGRPHRHGVRAVPPDRHGVAAVGAGHPGDRRCARRRRGAAQLGGPAVHVRLHPAHVRGGDGGLRGRGRQVVRRPLGRPSATGAPSPRRGGPVHQQRGEGGSGQSPHGGVFLDIATRRTARTSAAGSPPCTTSSRSWPAWTSPPRPWRWGRPATTSWAGSGSTPTRPPPP